MDSLIGHELRHQIWKVDLNLFGSLLMEMNQGLEVVKAQIPRILPQELA